MLKIYQKEWFGIEFKTFVKLDSKQIAGDSFYNLFYDAFYKRFSSYDDLPEDWKSGKRLVADFILHQTNSNDIILSIGCGNGYVEHILTGRNIIAIEPSLKATKFLKRNGDNVRLYNGYFPQCLKDTDYTCFDLAYMSAAEYCFNKEEFDVILKQIYDFDIKKFVLISVSWYDRYGIKQFVKDTTKKVLTTIKLYELGQFWGYKRTSGELVEAFLKAGFKNIEDGYLQNGQYWIKGVKQ